MKRFLLPLLILCFLLPAVYGVSESAALTPLEQAYQEGGSEAVWALVTPRYGVQYIERDRAVLSITQEESMIFASEPTAGTNYFPQCLYHIRIQETNGVGFTIEQVNLYDYLIGADSFTTAYPIKLDGDPYLNPFGSLALGTGRPRSNALYGIYEVIGTDDFGNRLFYYGVTTQTNIIQESAATTNPEYDTQNLRLEASFEEQVAPGVWWVPASSLGKTSYTNSDVAANINQTPEEKQQRYATLYEALQLFQIGNFSDSQDNERIQENGINWEHHKPGYHAVRTNTGCCASDSSWLSYILQGDYEEVGFLAYSYADGSGHVLNYIKHEGYYYFIDLTHYRTDFLSSSAVESGLMADYRTSDFVAGNLHKATSPEAYADYCIASFNTSPKLFFLYQAVDCLPVDSVHSGKGITITYAEGPDIQVVYDDPTDSLYYARASAPTKTYPWQDLPDAQFSVDEAYLASQSQSPSESTFGLSVQVGDRLTLAYEDRKSSSITVNGETLVAANTGNFRALFDESIRFDRSNNRVGWASRMFNVKNQPDEVREMDTLWVGEWMLDFSGLVSNTQIVCCKEVDGQLEVTDILTNRRSMTERVFLTRDDRDRWQSIGPCWYLVTYEVDGVTHQEFAQYEVLVTGYPDTDTAAASEVSIPLQGMDVQVGDVLSLSIPDPAHSGPIQVNEISFDVSSSGSFSSLIQSSWELYGGNDYGYLSHELPLHLHQDRIQDQQSITLGEFVLTIDNSVNPCQVVCCNEQDGQLVVTDVLTDPKEWTETLTLTRDAQGAWQPISPRWYLITCIKNGTRYQEYAGYCVDIDDPEAASLSTETSQSATYGMDVKIGDVLSLSNPDSECRSPIQVNGISFDASPSVRFSSLIQSSWELHGGSSYDFHLCELPLHLHQDRIRDKQVLTLGEFVLTIENSVSQFQVVCCNEQDGHLVVTDILTDPKEYAEALILTQDAQGAWQPLSPRWFLITCERDGACYQEYAGYRITVQ